MLDHPQGHLVSDHVALFWHFLKVSEATGDDFDEIGFGGSWQGESPLGEEIACGVDVVFDQVGSNRDARNGLSLYEDEGDGVAGKEVVLHREGG